MDENLFLLNRASHFGDISNGYPARVDFISSPRYIRVCNIF